MSIARTNATGDTGMLAELLAWSSSLTLDRQMVREDLLGSAAHVTMLARTKLVPLDDAKKLREALLKMHAEAEQGKLVIPDGEEDVHMAVESLLQRRLGPIAGRLHTARSRNDQVALDLRLHVRGQAAATLSEAGHLVSELATRAGTELQTILPAYTHRQRAQPVSAGFVLAAWASQLSRAADVIWFALGRCDRMPLGSGACSGTSLPIDRSLTARLLGFSVPTLNALDTVGDRDFALDWCWAAARVLIALSRLATDVIDFASSEFGLVKLDGKISAGSSMMPQKKNPDVFELVRGQSSRAIGSVMQMLTLVKGLPTGYNRDLQEDRRAILEAGPLARGAVSAVRASLPFVQFDAGRGAGALADGSTQATDLAEALVRKGVPFREAYQAVGALVKKANDEGVWLSGIDPAIATKIHAGLDAKALEALDPATAVAAKESFGGTGPKSVRAQIDTLRDSGEMYIASASEVPTLASIAEIIAAEPMEPR
jgi:argininosuccinate lyase